MHTIAPITNIMTLKWTGAATRAFHDLVRDEYYPLVVLRCGDDLPLGWKTVGDFLRQVPGRPKLGDVLLLDGGSHPLALTSGSGHG